MKKILVLLLGFIFIAVGCNKNDDFVNDATQSTLKSADTKTYQWKTESGYFTPLICDGEMIDYLEGDITAHFRWHILANEDKWVLVNFEGELTSQMTGETFKIKEKDRIKFEEGMMDNYTIHWNIMGDMGNHYVGSGYVALDTWEVVAEKSLCP
ncbi:hypothetical protein [Mangrovibacterium lignilyticum]|uniref:hypothetical protein n=1 Tax=Mangrovibacterium lignilyticum TaxID=2668052 RepID=UPI0013D5194E|nr:hypothetical protein [Mangrovibacterium lignilyticum]